MKSRFITLLFFMSISVILIESCKKKEDEGNENETKISSFGDTESHNMGQNCMSCHKSGGTGEGWFNVAGTVYDSLKTNTYPNTIIKLYSEPNGAGMLKHTIQVDGKGNFYTTANIDFGSGLYPAVVSNSGVKYMSSATTTGTCVSCHGVSTDKIWAK